MAKGYKYLAKNIGLLTISNFGTKLLSFFLVPLYTSILTTVEYGTYDLFNTTVSVLVPLLTVNIQEAVLRFAIDKDNNKKGIFTMSVKFLLIGYVPLSVFIIINHIYGIIPILKEYSLIFFVMYFFLAASGIISSFARGMDHVLDVSIAGILSSAVMISANIVTLVFLKWGLVGYFLSHIFGTAVQSIYLFVRIKAWKFIDIKSNYKKLQSDMFAYSKPLIANSIAWLVNNMSDRYVVTMFLGLAENGVYSVGYKIPTILNVFQTIFNQAWSLSAVREFDSEDKDGFFSNLYNVYGCFMVVVCSVLIMLDKPLAKLLYAKEFYVAWRYVPFLTMAIVFGALSGVTGGVFTAVKDSKTLAKSTVIGALVNTVMNFMLVPVIGAIGAAIATAVSFIVVWLMRLRQVNQYISLQLNIVRDILSYVLLAIQTIIIFLDLGANYQYILEAMCLGIIALLYHSEIIMILSKFKVKLGLK